MSFPWPIHFTWPLALLALLALIVYTPLGNLIFGTEPLPLWAWGPLVLGAVGLLFADEIRKMVLERAGRRPPCLLK